MNRLRYAILAMLIASVTLAGPPVVAAGNAESVIFVRVPNGPNGSPGIYYEPFMFHFGRSAHVGGSQIVKLSPPTPAGELTVLTEGFFGVEEPELSWDGKKILFSGKRTAQDGWEVWEMNVDGSGIRQVTHDMADVCSPHYLPDGRIVFSSTRHMAMDPERNRDEYDRDQARLAHRCESDGSDVEQLTFNVSSDSEFVVMRDGRLMFQSWQHHGMRFHASGASAFFTMNPDGTGFIDFWGNHRGGFRWKQRELPDGRIVFIDGVFHHSYGGGQLAVITPGDPNDAQTLQVLTPDVKKYGPDSPGGRYRDPYPTEDGRLMVSWSEPPAWSGYRNPGGPAVQFGLYWFDFDRKAVGKPIYTDDRYQALNPIFVEARPMPPVIPDHGVDRQKTSGTLLCLNAYLGQLDKEAFIKPGEIKSVRIIEGFGINDEDPFFRTFPPGIGYSSFGSSSNSISNFEQKRVVGEVPVQSDGSFYAEVPADTVLHWQTLDENGMALQDALTWAWVRPGERRVCLGCHENRTEIPDLAAVPLAAKLPPAKLNIPRDQRRTVDFRRDLVPIIEAKCVRCHDDSQPAAGLDLSHGDQLVYQRTAVRSSGASQIRAAVFNRAYLNLSANANSKLGKFIYPGFARKSPLIWRLFGRSFVYDSPVNQCPPDSPLTDQEKSLFSLWVDLGAQWDNLPGKDDFISYSREESAKLAKQDDAYVRAPIRDVASAAAVRCGECHGLTRALAERKSANEWKEIVAQMGAKRRDWIKPEEINPIAEYLHKITEDAGVLRHWQVCGPFDNAGGAAIRTVLSPERSVDLKASYPGQGKTKATWRNVELTDETGVLNFEKYFGKRDRVAAYALATVRSDRDQRVALRISGDDMFEVFVNGDKVLQRLVAQPFEYDKDIVPIDLVKGDNRIMVKVFDFSGAWRMRARLTADEGPASPSAGLIVSRRIAAAKE